VAFDISADKRLAEEMLKIRNLESVSLLAGGIAHDFNNLLTVIGGNITLAKSYIPPTSPALLRLLDAEQACRRSTALTGQLLTFSQGGSPVRQVASITELITESVVFALHGSKVHCAVTLAPDLWVVEVDAGQVHQVLHNILRNADQAMPHGGTLRVSAENVHLTATAALPLAPGNYVKVTVEDQGVGVPASHLTRIFEPYFTTKEYGSGLGLATSYAIIRNHGGHMTVTSQEGVGTTISIYLPASPDVLPPSKKIEAEPVSGIGKVLLMDDDPAVRRLVLEMLRRLGYEVVCANNGTEAIRLHRQAYDSGQPFDVLLLDLTVPGDLGAEATLTQILQCEAQVKAIVVSGYARAPIVVDFRRYGFQGSLVKPYSIHELSARLRSVLQPAVGGQD
jgi:CheY-like chemotaxis protein